MNRLLQIIAMLLLALWMPVTMHCDLEALPGFGFLVCGSHPDAAPHQNADCEEDICASVESGACRMEDNQPVAFPPLALLPVATCDEFHVAPLPVASSLGAASAPPELSAGWQFSARAAPPVRAPSFVS